MTKIRWNKKLDTLTSLISLSLVLVFSSIAGAQMEITYKRSGAPVAQKPKDTTPVQITYIKTTAKKKSTAKAKPAKQLVAAKKVASPKVKVVTVAAKKPVTKKTIAQKSRKPVRVTRVAAPAPVTVANADPIDFDSSLETSAPVATETSTMTFAPETKKAPAKSWGVSTGMTYTRSMVDQKDGSMGSFLDFSAGGSYKFEFAKISATLLASRDMKAEESTIDDFLVGVSLNPIKVFNDSLILTPNGSIGPAISKGDQYASLVAKTKLGLRMGLDSEKLGMGNFGVDGSVDVRKNFHEYTTARSGSVNTEYGSLQTVGASYSFTEKLSLAFNIIHLNTWTYNGIQAEYFSHAQELSYAVSKSVSISGGHQLGYPFVAAWKDTGTDRNFDLTNDTDSFIFATLSVSY